MLTQAPAPATATPVFRSRALPLATCGAALLLAALPAPAQDFGTALAFDGSSAEPDEVTFGDVAALDFGTSPFTIAFWIRKPDPRLEAVVSKRPTCDEGRFWSLRAADAITLAMWDGPGVVHRVGIPAPIADGAWHHVAFTREGPTVRAYLDGEPAAESEGPTTFDLFNDAPLRMGTDACTFLDGTSPFSGALDELLVWGEARTEAEIRDDLAGGLTGSEPGLLGYWTMDEGAGQVVGDAVAGNDGVLGSTPEADVNDPAWVAGVSVATEAAPDRAAVALHPPYPNPTARSAAVAFELSRPGRVRVALYDVLGREVAAVAEGVGAPGRQEFGLDTGGLPPGLYVLRLQAEDGSATRPLTVLR